MNLVQATNQIGWGVFRFDNKSVGWHEITQPMTHDLAQWFLDKMLPADGVEYRVGKVLEPRK